MHIVLLDVSFRLVLGQLNALALVPWVPSELLHSLEKELGARHDVLGGGCLVEGQCSQFAHRVQYLDRMVVCHLCFFEDHQALANLVQWLQDPKLYFVSRTLAVKCLHEDLDS